MQASIEQRGPDLFCRSPDTRPSENRIEGEQARAALNGWAARYDAAVAQGNAGALLGIGRELFDWLDPTGWASAWALGAGPRSIEIRVEDPKTPLARAPSDVDKSGWPPRTAAGPPMRPTSPTPPSSQPLPRETGLGSGAEARFGSSRQSQTVRGWPEKIARTPSPIYTSRPIAATLRTAGASTPYPSPIPSHTNIK